jgi:hypothetical protein
MHASIKLDAEKKKNMMYCKMQWMKSWSVGSQGRNAVSSLVQSAAKET